MKELWVEKYRPKDIGGYVFKDEKQKAQIAAWLQQGALPHMLLSGSPGVGKSTIIKVLLNELGVSPYDVLEVNASRDNGVDFIRDTITRFAETNGYGDMRYVFLDEADGLSAAAQGTLRGTMEKYSTTVRFLLTCNYPHKLINAIHSRCEPGRMHIENLDQGEFYLRLVNILDQEKIEIDPDALEAIVQKTYPDMRRGISMLQANSLTGKLLPPDQDSEKTSELKTDIIVLFKARQFKEAREMICKNLPLEEYDDMFRFMYNNAEIWTNGDEAKLGPVIITIRDGLVKHQAIGDAEINLSATFCELEEIAKS